MSTDLVLAQCPFCGNGLGTCAGWPENLAEQLHEIFCRLATRYTLCERCNEIMIAANGVI